MLSQKRFGRKISVPSTAEIRRELVNMARADTVVELFKGRGVTRDAFENMVSGLVADNLLSSNRAQILTLRFERTEAESASRVDDRGVGAVSGPS